MTHSTAKPVPSARRLAYQALYDVLEKDAYSNIVLQRILAEYPLKAEEAHLLTELREKRMHSSMMRSPITSRAGSSKTGRPPGA